MKKVLSMLLVLCMVLGMSVSVFAEGATVLDLTATSAITEEGSYIVNAYNGTNSLTINADATLTLKDVTITAAEGVSAISIESGNVTLILEGDNKLTGGKNGAGIYVAEDASLTIQSSNGGTLVALGNNISDTIGSGAAGIGGTYENGDSGTIIIDNATVAAEGHGDHASGIGSGFNGISGPITIKNNSVVVAYGGHYSEGGELQSDYGKHDPEGSAAIGGGAKTGGTIKPIVIQDSRVFAYGGSKAAGIGAAFWASCELIDISNSTIHAYGGSSSAGIGTSRAGDGVSATIKITDSTVNAVGGYYGAGIGGGYNGDSLSNLPTTTISISGGEITAEGQNGGAGIGGGYKTNNLSIEIKDEAKVTAIASVLNDGSNKTIDQTAASAIGSGANGSGTFEGSNIEIDSNSDVTVLSYAGGKEPVEDSEDNGSNGAVSSILLPGTSSDYVLNLDYNGWVDENGFSAIGLKLNENTYELPVLTWEGNTFLGWLDDKGAAVSSPVTLTAGTALNLFASWETKQQAPELDDIITEKEETYKSVIAATSNGSVKVDSKKATRGEKVTITVTPDKGYELAALSVIDEDGNERKLTENENGTFSFRMPEGGVTIEAEFAKIGASVSAPSTEKENPSTGASDFVGAAAALAVVSVMGMAALSLKK